MFDKETTEKNKKALEQWQKDCSEKYPGRDFKASTESGTAIKPIYTPEDIQDIPIDEIAMPGQYPYTRGIYPVHYQFQPWIIQNEHGYDLPEHTRERMDLLAKEGLEGYFGMTTFNLICDSASKAGFDPGEPEAEGIVGYGGISLGTIEDMDRLFHDMALDRTSVVLNVSDMSMIGLAMYIVYAERQGIPKQKLRGNTVNYQYRGAFMDSATFVPQSALKLMVELIKYCTKHMPQWNTTNICGYFVEETGGTPAQEIAFTIAVSIAVTEMCLEIGLNPDDFLPRFSFQIGQRNDFFECITKLRALRKVWAKVNRERFGCRNPRSLQARVHVQTAGSTLTAQQPLNNIVRFTLQALGAVLGGANAIQTNGYDEALSIPSGNAAILSLRTQQIIRHETNLTSVSDPLAGSYYVEWLTKRIEEESFELLDQIERMGGFLKCWEKGWFRAELERVAYRWQEKVNCGESVIVGVNKYTSSEVVKVRGFQHDPTTEKIAAERVRQFKQKRDGAKTAATLAELSRVARIIDQEGNKSDLMLMDTIIEAVRCNATLGEIAGVIKEVFGWGNAY